MAADNMRWRPDMAEMREWRTGDGRLQHYFDWLQTQNPLPPVPEGEDHPGFADMLEMLRELHKLDEDTLSVFRKGGFKDHTGELPLETLRAARMECEDSSWGATAQYLKDQQDATRYVITEMLLFKGELTPAIVDDYLERITTLVLSSSAG